MTPRYLFLRGRLPDPLWRHLLRSPTRGLLSWRAQRRDADAAEERGFNQSLAHLGQTTPPGPARDAALADLLLQAPGIRRIRRVREGLAAYSLVVGVITVLLLVAAFVTR